MAAMAAISAKLEGKFQYHAPKLGWIYVSGGLFALVGVVLSVLGIRSRSLVRWHGLSLSAGMLLLWCLWLSGE